MSPTLGDKILNAAAALVKRGEKTVERKKVAAKCGYRRGEDGSYKNALRALRNKKKYLEYEKDTITLTDLGIENADISATAEINGFQDALADAKKNTKGSKSKQILDILADGEVHTREEIGEKIDHDHTLPSFKNMLYPMKSADYIHWEKSDKVGIRLSDSMLKLLREED